MTTRAPRGEARRALILDAALRVVGREGAGALTHRRVAAEAGLPAAATTYWFASKDALLHEAYALAAERDIARVREVAARVAGRPLPDALAAVLTVEPDRDALIACYTTWLEAARAPALRPIESRWSEAYVTAMRVLLQAAGARDPERDAPLLASTIEGLQLELLVSGGDVASLRPQLERLAELLG